MEARLRGRPRSGGRPNSWLLFRWPGKRWEHHWNARRGKNAQISLTNPTSPSRLRTVLLVSQSPRGTKDPGGNLYSRLYNASRPLLFLGYYFH